MSKNRESVRARARRNRVYNQIAMFGITAVVCMLMVVLFLSGRSVQQKIDASIVKGQQLEAQIEQENQRTEEIEKMQKYIQSDEYIEKIAKEKIGLVKEDEILFKEDK